MAAIKVTISKEINFFLEQPFQPPVASASWETFKISMPQPFSRDSDLNDLGTLSPSSPGYGVDTTDVR